LIARPGLYPLNVHKPTLCGSLCDTGLL